VSQAEHPDRQQTGHEVTVDDVRQLVAAATPHFALQLRNRIAKLIRTLPAGNPVRAEGERAIEQLTVLGATGEVRGGHEPEPDMPYLSSVGHDVAALPAD
jgi:hypothetical protein